jgi:hypothetical protein
MYVKVKFDRIPYAPGLEATQGIPNPPCYKPFSNAPEEESDQWIKVGRKGKRRSKKSFKQSL